MSAQALATTSGGKSSAADALLLAAQEDKNDINGTGSVQPS